MNVKTSRIEAIGGGVLSNAGRAWNDFWFAPADPTTLAVIRILCGALTLYVHLAYSYDLQEFFGKDGWYSLQRANMERREFPRVAPTPDWYAYSRTLPPILDPDSGQPDAERRKNVIAYIREVVNDPDPTARATAARLL